MPCAGGVTRDELARIVSLIYAVIKHNSDSISIVHCLFSLKSFSIKAYFSSPLASRYILFIVYNFRVKLEALLPFF